MKQFIGLAVAWLLLALSIGLLEHFWPSNPSQCRLRRGFWTDLAYWFFTPFITKGITRLAVIAGILFLASRLPLSLENLRDQRYSGFGPLGRQPLWLQAMEIILLADLIGYWSHRWFHNRMLWKFHAVHHSSEEVDWLSAVRVHPLNDAVTKLLQTIPLVALGFNPWAAAGAVPFLTLYAILLHANLNWSFGRLGYLIASPVFHRWHHTKEKEALDKNFSGLFAFWDLVFGTFYLPPGKIPEDFGIPESMPESLTGQLLYPFRGPQKSKKP